MACCRGQEYDNDAKARVCSQCIHYLQPLTAPVQLLGFPFTWFLHVSYRLPLFVYMAFLLFWQAFFFLCIFFMFVKSPFCDLHGFYVFLTGFLFSFTWFLYVSHRLLFFIYTVFTCFLQAPFFDLHCFYTFLTGPIFSFTWFLQGYKHNISRLFTAFA